MFGLTSGTIWLNVMCQTFSLVFALLIILKLLFQCFSVENNVKTSQSNICYLSILSLRLKIDLNSTELFTFKRCEPLKNHPSYIMKSMIFSSAILNKFIFIINNFRKKQILSFLKHFLK